MNRRPHALYPFLFRIRGGFLLGLAFKPEEGSPCVGCVDGWLTDRNVFHEPADLAELKIRRELLAELLLQNTPHVYFEIQADGTSTRLEGLVCPHPRCHCAKTNYVGPESMGKNTHFAFSPITELVCSRYSLPQGNLWLARATGPNWSHPQETIAAYGVATEREDARFNAFQEWLKRSAGNTATDMVNDVEVLQTGVQKQEYLGAPSANELEGVGCGANHDEAVVDALHELARKRVLQRYAASMKTPLLVVGANSWLRDHVPFFLLQRYDLHLLFYPNSTPSWVVGVAALSRTRVDERPLFAFGSSFDPKKAFAQALGRLLIETKPWEEEDKNNLTLFKQQEVTDKKTLQLNRWWNHWIYRCSKISLRDVLHLESYPNTKAHWREFFKDGEPDVKIQTLNNPLLPASLRAVASVRIAEVAMNRGKVRGIGSWATFPQN